MNRSRAFLLVFIVSLLGPTLSSAAEFFFERDSSLPLVYVTVAFRGGATQDAENKSGATNLMGQLMLRGTKYKTKQQIDLALDQLGATLEFEPRSEFIAFRGLVLSENLDAYLSLLEEILSKPSFRAQELDRLKKEKSSELLNELSQDRNLVRLRFEETFFKGHPYAKPNSGRIKDLKDLTTADIQAQYQKLVHEQSMIVLGAGDAESKSFEPFLGKIKAALPGTGSLNPIREFNGEPQKLRVVIFDKPDRTQTQVMIGQKGVSIKDPDLDALELANHAFGGGGFQARLMVELRVKRGWTYGAASAFKLGSTPHSWKMSFFPKNADTPPAIREALHMMEELKKTGITEQEFEASKKSLINSAGFRFNTPSKRMENRLTEVIYGLPEGYFKGYADRLSKLTREQVNGVMQKFLRPQNVMIGLVATSSLSKKAIADALKIPESQIEVQNYQKE